MSKHFYGFTSDGRVTSNQAYVRQENGHTTMWGYDGKRFHWDTRGPGGAEGMCDVSDVPLEIAARLVAESDVAECAEQGTDFSDGWGDIDSRSFDFSPWHGTPEQDEAWQLYHDAWKAEWLRRREAAP